MTRPQRFCTLLLAIIGSLSGCDFFGGVTPMTSLIIRPPVITMR